MRGFCQEGLSISRILCYTERQHGFRPGKGGVGMNLKEQIYVCTLARCGTITKAADELFLTAPALSMFLSTLEKNLGVRLFQRTGKNLQLTSIGREYVHYAEQMIQLKEQFDHVLAQEIGMQKRTVRIGVQQRRAISAVPWLMARLSDEFPNLNVVFKDGTFEELNKLLEQHQVDYIFYTMDRPVPDADYVVLKREPILVALPDKHRCNACAKESPGLRFPYLEISSLDGLPFILPQPSQSLRMAIAHLLEENRIRPSRIIEISHFEVIMRMVSQGVGIGFNREDYLGDLPPIEGIRNYYLGCPPACSPLVLLYPKRKKHGPYHDRLIEVFGEYLSSNE